MLLIFIGVCDLTIDLSWLSFESSIHMSFENILHCDKHLILTCLLTFQNLVMRLHFDVTSVDLNYVAHFYWCLWPNNRLVMTEFWKFNTYVIWEHIALWQTFDFDMFIDLSKPGHEITFWCYFCGLKLCCSFLWVSVT